MGLPSPGVTPDCSLSFFFFFCSELFEEKNLFKLVQLWCPTVVATRRQTITNHCGSQDFLCFCIFHENQRPFTHLRPFCDLQYVLFKIRLYCEVHNVNILNEKYL